MYQRNESAKRFAGQTNRKFLVNFKSDFKRRRSIVDHNGIKRIWSQISKDVSKSHGKKLFLGLKKKLFKIDKDGVYFA